MIRKNNVQAHKIKNFATQNFYGLLKNTDPLQIKMLVKKNSLFEVFFIGGYLLILAGLLQLNQVVNLYQLRILAILFLYSGLTISLVLGGITLMLTIKYLFLQFKYIKK